MTTEGSPTGAAGSPGSVEVVVVGDELLLGEVADTNTATLGRRLLAAGLALRRSTAVGDDVAAIRAVLAEAVTRRPRGVLVSGGLGPTSDDVTRVAVAALAGVPLVRDARLERGLEAWYAGLGRALPDLARQQADLPAGARIVANPIGSAAGFALDVAGVVLCCVPGVPGELAAMADAALAELADPADAEHRLVVEELRVLGLGESDIAARLVGFEAQLPAQVRLGYLARPGEVRLRLSARGVPGSRLSAYADQARRLLPAAAVLAGGTDLTVQVVQRLLALSASVAVAESLTGGGLGAAITAVPGASAVFRGGIVAYATEEKARLLGVDPGLLDAAGPVHPGVAAAMARGARERFGSAYALATTGVAGPDPAGASVGTVYVAVSAPPGERVEELHIAGDRAAVRTRSVLAALDLLRRTLPS